MLYELMGIQLCGAFIKRMKFREKIICFTIQTDLFDDVSAFFIMIKRFWHGNLFFNLREMFTKRL